MHAELVAICRSLYMAKHMGVDHVQVEMDSLEALHLIERGNAPTHIYRVILKDIKNI